MLTLCKFVHNDNEQSTNLLVSKTFGKFGVLDRRVLESREQKPNHNEWWYCRVTKETGAGTPKGIWLLDPIRRVVPVERGGFRENDIMHLFAGIYTSERVDNVLLLHPKKKGPNWICGNAMRRHLMITNRQNGIYGVNTIMVVFDDDNVWIKEAAKTEPGG